MILHLLDKSKRSNLKQHFMLTRWVKLFHHLLWCKQTSLLLIHNRLNKWMSRFMRTRIVFSQKSYFNRYRSINRFKVLQSMLKRSRLQLKIFKKIHWKTSRCCFNNLQNKKDPLILLSNSSKKRETTKCFSLNLQLKNRVMNHQLLTSKK